MPMQSGLTATRIGQSPSRCHQKRGAVRRACPFFRFAAVGTYGHVRRLDRCNGYPLVANHNHKIELYGNKTSKLTRFLST